MESPFVTSALEVSPVQSWGTLFAASSLIDTGRNNACLLSITALTRTSDLERRSFQGGK